jgi:signal-transduction protein with cAMP-binding, CBS, and nucleotidyltransferase domain
MHWQVNTEERLRVRAEDLYGVSTLFSKAVEHIAVKTTANANVYLIPKNAFLSMLQNYNVINEQEVRKT